MTSADHSLHWPISRSSFPRSCTTCFTPRKASRMMHWCWATWSRGQTHGESQRPGGAALQGESTLDRSTWQTGSQHPGGPETWNCSQPQAEVTVDSTTLQAAVLLYIEPVQSSRADRSGSGLALLASFYKDTAKTMKNRKVQS